MSPRRRRPRSLASILIALTVGVGLLASVTGYAVGEQQSTSDFNPDQQEFMAGLIVGTQLRTEHEHQGQDLKLVCASRFYPARPNSMAGCLAGLTDRPPGGYHLPG